MNLHATLKRLIGAFVISFIAASPSANAAASVVVPGCAPIHPPTCVQWKKLNGGGWSVQNKCGAAVSVTLDKKSSTPILPPGLVYPVDIKPSQYLVFDSGEYDKWAKSIPKRSWGQFHDEVGNPCQDKLLVAQQSGGENSNVGQAPSSSATTSSNQGKQSIAKCGRKSPVIQNSVAIYKEDWIEIVQDSPLKIVNLSRFGEDGMLNKSEPYSLDISYAIDNLERGLRIHCEGPGCANLRNGQKQRIEWLQCLSSVFEAKTLASNQGIKSSSEHTANSGGAAQLNAGSDRMTTSSSNASDTTIQKGEAKGGRRESPTAKYVSKDATHCVEVVPKGFKCDGPYDQFLTNICMTKISVRWRLGSDPWGLQELPPKGCIPVSPFRDQRSVQFKACSWDSKASHGPYSNPCRY